MIPDSIRSEILRRIAAAEKEHGVRVLLAVESGSRPWGFESPNSDYDARFIYLHPAEWYLSVDLEDKRDVIEYPIVDEIDLNGWDIRKALRLFSKSNPAFVEWIQSPLVYVEHGSFANRVRSLLPVIYSCAKGVAHYRSMAKTNSSSTMSRACSLTSMRCWNVNDRRLRWGWRCPSRQSIRSSNVSWIAWRAASRIFCRTGPDGKLNEVFREVLRE